MRQHEQSQQTRKKPLGEHSWGTSSSTVQCVFVFALSQSCISENGHLKAGTIRTLQQETEAMSRKAGQSANLWQVFLNVSQRKK